MEQLGYIKQFGTYSSAQLERLRTDFDLTMPISALQFAADHYRTAERRDPQIDELLLWDCFFAKFSADPAADAPSEMTTQNDFVSQTYADCMEKRALCRPNVGKPACIGETVQIANTYLKRIGKYLPHAAILPLLEPVEPFSFETSAEKAIAPAGSDFRLRILPHQLKKTSPKKEVLLLLRGERNRFVPDATALTPFLTVPAVADQIRGIKSIDSRGLLKAVLSLADGAWINLSCLSKTGEAVPLSLLTDGYHGAYLLRVSAESLRDLGRFATVHHLSLIYFADVLTTPVLRITRVNKQTFSVDSVFPRALPQIRPVSVSLGEESHRLPLAVSHSPAETVVSPYFSFSEIHLPSDVVAIDGTFASGASVHPSHSYFLHALYGVLAPVCALAVCGCDYGKQRLAIGIRLSEELPTDTAALCSATLGIYRAQAELAIPSQTEWLFSDVSKHAGSLGISAFAFAPSVGKRPLPRTFQQVGNSVYLVAVPVEENGLPVFAALRNLLTELSDWAKTEKIQSAAVLVGENPTDVLSRMRQNGSFCRLCDERIASQGDLPLAFLLESAESLPLCKIGTVLQEEPTEEEVQRSPFSERTSLIWSDRPAVTVLACERDAAAATLIAHLKQRGAEVRAFRADQDPAGPLSNAILRSQTVLLCRGAALPEDATVRFALSVMKQAGGVCIAFENAVKDADICLPKGFSENDLEILFPISKKNE